MKQKGFVIVPILIITVLLLAVVYVTFKTILFNNNRTSTLNITQGLTPTIATTDKQVVKFDRKAPNTWKIYKGAKSGFTFKYPPELSVYEHYDDSYGFSLGFYLTSDDLQRVENCYKEASAAWKESMQCLDSSNDGSIIFYINEVELAFKQDVDKLLENQVQLAGKSDDFKDALFLEYPARLSVSDNCLGNYSSCEKQLVFHRIFAAESENTMLNITLTASTSLDRYSDTILSSLSK